MKNILKAFGVGCCALLASCNTEVESLDMQVPAVPKNMEALRLFKSSEHAVSLTWYANWKADGNMNAYLNTLADSLDIVILETGYENISAAQQVDLAAVQEVKGTKVLVSVDMDQWTAGFDEKMSQAEAEAEEAAEEAAKKDNPQGEATPEQIKEAVMKAQAKVKEAFTLQMKALPGSIGQTVNVNGYNGVSLRSAGTKDSFVRDNLYAVIDQLSAKFGPKAGAGLFVLEGKLDYFSTRFGLFNYIISNTVNPSKLMAVQEEYDKWKSVSGFNGKQYLVYLSIENDDWMTPYPDVISSSPLTEPKYQTLALWLPNDGTKVGGMALKGIDKNYQRNYPVLRNTIHYLNLK